MTSFASPAVAAARAPIQFTRAASASASASSILGGLVLDAERLALAPGATSGTSLSRSIEPGFPLSQLLQVAARCFLVYEVHGLDPSHGLLVLAGGTEQRVEFTPAIEGRFLHTMAQMRALLRADAEPAPLGCGEVPTARLPGDLLGPLRWRLASCATMR
jgi:hypothetical protein